MKLKLALKLCLFIVIVFHLSLFLPQSFYFCPFFSLSQKVSLWQHADELEQEQVAKGIWLDSREVTDCMSCQVPFTIFNRKVILIYMYSLIQSVLLCEMLV